MSWRAIHFYYHVNRDLLLRLLIAPLWQTWSDRAWVSQAFFIRYPLGGNHIRFRYLTPNLEPAIVLEMERELADLAESFFHHHPSTEGRNNEVLKAQAQSILASDSGETDDRIFPDNSWREAAFVPEVERYGGPAVLPDSFALFDLSSRRVLQILEAEPEMRKARRLNLGMSLLVEQAAAFSRSGSELGELFDYASPWATPAVIAKADQVFETQATALSNALFEVFRGVASKPNTETAATPLALGSSRLRQRLDDEEIPAARIRGIAESHLHMTANRLGLSNFEEAYLCRLLSRCFSSCNQ